MMKLRRGVGPLLGAVLLVVAAGCRDDGPGSDGAEDAEPEDGGTAIIAQNADLEQPMAIMSQGGLDAFLQDVFYMNLLKGDWEDGHLVLRTAEESPMALARGFEYVGADSTALRYRLRSDVKWSDGRPITAHDVVFTFELLADPMVPSPRRDYTQHLESVTAENDSTVFFQFRRRYPEMLFHTAHGIIPRHVYEGVAPSELASHPSQVDPGNGGLVVSGPYQVGSWTRGQQVVLTRNAHFRPRGHLDRIVFRVVPDATTRMVELQTGAVDWVNGVGFDQIPGLRQQAPHVRLELEEKRFYDYIAYNAARVPAFEDLDVRRAMGLAIDRPGLLRALQMEEFAVPANGPYAPIFADLFDPEMIPQLPHDPEEARRILAAKGWADSNGDGIVEKDGEPFTFTLVTNAGNQRRADVSQIVQQQWRQIGVDAKLQAIEFATLMDALVREDYEVALGGWGVPLSSDLTGLWGVDSPLNIVSYEDSQTQGLFQQALSQPTEAAAAPYWKEAARELVADHPYTWLYFMDQVNGINERLRGVKVNTFGPYQNAWEWWIPRSQQRGATAPAAADSAP